MWLPAKMKILMYDTEFSEISILLEGMKIFSGQHLDFILSQKDLQKLRKSMAEIFIAKINFEYVFCISKKGYNPC